MKTSIRRVAAVASLSLVGGLGAVALAPVSEADAQAYGRSRVTHSGASERKWIITSTEYNGKASGHRDQVERGHRLPASAGKIKSVWVPKGCTIVTNGFPYQTAWTKGAWANIGKMPFVTVKLKMDCGLVKQWTG